MDESQVLSHLLQYDILHENEDGGDLVCEPEWVIGEETTLVSTVRAPPIFCLSRHRSARHSGCIDRAGEGLGMMRWDSQ